MSKHEELTQRYSTWGDKLLQHTEVLYDIQYNKQFAPITIQIALCEVCDSHCPFCSVAERPLKSFIPFHVLEKALLHFSYLGAKSVELTGGGNPLLYRDKAAGKDINDVIDVAHNFGYDIGVITNSHDISRHLKPGSYDKINWLRVSLTQLDEGWTPEEYNFANFPYAKLGFSYIIHSATTSKTIDNISKLVDIHPDIKFVRIAGDCLIKGNNVAIRDQWKDILESVDKHDKIFIKDIGDNDSPFDHGCYVGLIRPYIAPHPNGGDYQVYICTSHVLQKRTYDLKYSLGSVSDIITIWNTCNERFEKTGYPYEVNCNKGKCWSGTCKFCYYKFNNQLLHSVANEMPDKNFP